MRSFTYAEPTSLDDALGELALDGDGTRPIAGGQSLLLDMKDRVRSPGRLVSLARLGQLRGWRQEDGQLALGAATSYRDLNDSPPDGAYAGLGRVAGDIADLPVRTMATVGGAVCQADPRFDMPAVATLLGAQFVLQSTAGERRVRPDEFFIGERQTAVRPDELLTALEFAVRPTSFWWAFRKFRLRSMDAALASVGVAGLREPGGVLRDPVVVVGACTAVPARFGEVEQLLDGAASSQDLHEQAAERLAALVDPAARVWPFPPPSYLRHVCGVLLRRALTQPTEAGNETEDLGGQ